MTNKEYRHFILYDNATGKIFQDGKIPEDSIQHQTTDTKTAMESRGESHLTHYVDLSGETPTIVKMPDRPDEFCSFDYGAHAWLPDANLAAALAIDKRGVLLAASDWTQLPDVPLETKTAWATYRQSLRDITEQTGFPFDVIWRSMPV